MAIEKLELLFKKVFAGKAISKTTTAYFEEPNIANARIHVQSKDVWSEAHLIPDSGIGDPTGSVPAGEATSSGVVTYYSASTFGGIPGASTAYSSSLQDVIPFNFGDGTTYNYILMDKTGTQIPQADESDWTFDPETGILIFHSANPGGVSHSNLPLISAYTYTGKKLNQAVNTSEVTASSISLGGVSHADWPAGGDSNFTEAGISGSWQGTTGSFENIAAQTGSFTYISSSGGARIFGDIGAYTASDSSSRLIGLQVENDVSASGFVGEFWEISSSILVTSESTVFGNSEDDFHKFIGDVAITGSLSVSTHISASSVSASTIEASQITGSMYITNSGSLTILSASHAFTSISSSHAINALSASYVLTPSKLYISGSSAISTTANTFISLSFDYSTGIHVTASTTNPDNAIVSLGSAFHEIRTNTDSGSVFATGSDILDISGSGGISITSDNNAPEARIVIDGSGISGTGGGFGIFKEIGSTEVFETTSSLVVSGTLDISGSIEPADNITYNLGSKGKKWKQVFAQDTFFGGVHELNMTVPGLGKYPLGTILVWRNGTLVPCDEEADYMIMGVVKPPADSPVILGAEDILVTGKVDEGDFIITSNKVGHGIGVKQNWLFKKDLFGKVIAQALESCDGESNLIRAMIRKM